MHRAGDQWTVAQRADYPADASKVHKLLLSLADAKIVEEKTSNPANFSIIGVDDPAKPGAAGTQITLTTKDGKHSVIVGKPTGEGNFARRGGENRSFTVEPGISADVEPQGVDRFAPARRSGGPDSERRGEVSAGRAAGYTVHRLKPGEDGICARRRPARRPQAPGRQGTCTFGRRAEQSHRR